MIEPTYSFTIPSLHDRTPLDCRIYLPKRFAPSKLGVIQAAIVAHPYAPLGGCFDDGVVLSVTETLLLEGFIVGTFNFRGAGGSAGRTSLTGKAEQADYESFIGLIVTYCREMTSGVGLDGKGENGGVRTLAESKDDVGLDLLLAGYSYGSLVLARLPPVNVIISRFHDPAKDSVQADIIHRANTLSLETKRQIGSFQERPGHSGLQEDTTSHGQRGNPISVTLGEEQARRQKKRRSIHLRKSSNTHHQALNKTPEPSTSTGDNSIFEHYLLISPVLLPFTHSLCPPGSPSIMQSLGRATAASSHRFSYLDQPTLAIFGDSDGFTSSQRLRTWAEKQSQESSSFEWEEIQDAGHFWREDGAMQALQEKVVSWSRSLSGKDT